MDISNIKFRGMDVVTGKWEKGFLVSTIEKDEQVYWIYKTLKNDLLIGHKVFPESVALFTGYKDKQGREIYGGSIAKFYPYGCERIGLVEFINGGWKLGGFDLMFFGSERIEVIGNIIETPYLLQQNY